MVSILTRETMWLQLRALEEEKASSSVSSNPSDAVIFFGMSLVLGIACRHALRGTRVPYTVALLVLGIALGALGRFVCFIHSFCSISLDFNWIFTYLLT